MRRSFLPGHYKLSSVTKWASRDKSELKSGFLVSNRTEKMNSAEAAEEGPNEPDTDPFFKTGGLQACTVAVWMDVCLEALVGFLKIRIRY